MNDMHRCVTCILHCELSLIIVLAVFAFICNIMAGAKLQVPIVSSVCVCDCFLLGLVCKTLSITLTCLGCRKRF